MNAVENPMGMKRRPGLDDCHMGKDQKQQFCKRLEVSCTSRVSLNRFPTAAVTTYYKRVFYATNIFSDLQF